MSVDYGAWVGRSKDGQLTEIAIFPDSAAEEAGIRRDDIILEVNGEKVTRDNPLAEIILKYKPGDEVNMKVLREEKEENISAVLKKRND